FFEEPSDHSRVKLTIVAKYFGAWAKVVMSAAKGRTDRIAYLDLFAGPGRYADGTPSTPIVILKKAIRDEGLQQSLVTLFNDKDPANAQSLREAIYELPGVEKLAHRPQIKNDEIGQEIVGSFRETRFVPTLLFVDPWGYKGLSLSLIGSVLKDWGCDCIFFFNYNRINAGLNNEAVREHMDVLFGGERAQRTRQRLEGLSSGEREALIIEELSEALRETGAKYVLPFTFRNAEGTRTTHHLIFCSKHFKGYEIMKEIMARESTKQDQGVPSFVYSPASSNYPLLFELSRPLDDLEDMLRGEFAGQSLRMKEIYERHNVCRRYVKSNYKAALARLEATGKITTDPPAQKRPKKKGTVTFGDNVIVTFPRGVNK
ncbi:MAG: three-Cys-motif partner protein TcmP, partial [Acidobacteria bacterium]|nr:three-Cys-motif partner protein TcmP [Acidobacteriota bacterium]